MRLLRILALSVLLVGLSSPSWAATYYVDYVGGNDANNGTSSGTAWKRSPGMVGFTGTYSHAAGDLILFKGGVTWPAATLPLTVGYSGTAGNVDTYRVATSGEWSGSTGYATFDGELTDTNLLTISGRNYVRISGLDFYRNDVGNYKAVDVSSASYIELDHNHVQPGTWIGLYIHSTASMSNLSIHHNDIENVAMGVVVATGGACTIDTVDIYNNAIHDFVPAMTGGRHGDGIHLWGSPTNATWIIQNVHIYNNDFYGSWWQTGSAYSTGFVFMEDTVKNVLINNNLFYPVHTNCPTGGNSHQGYIVNELLPSGTDFGYVRILNNTFVGDAGCAAYAGAAIDTSGDSAEAYTSVVNNIFENIRYVYYDGGSINTTFVQRDYNVALPITGWHLGATSLTAWRAATPYDDASYSQTASLTNNIPDVGSVAIGAGADLSAYFTTDYLGTTRTVPWDIGAYEQGTTNTSVISGGTRFIGSVRIQ